MNEGSKDARVREIVSACERLLDEPGVLQAFVQDGREDAFWEAKLRNVIAQAGSADREGPQTDDVEEWLLAPPCPRRAGEPVAIQSHIPAKTPTSGALVAHTRPRMATGRISGVELTEHAREAKVIALRTGTTVTPLAAGDGEQPPALPTPVEHEHVAQPIDSVKVRTTSLGKVARWLGLALSVAAGVSLWATPELARFAQGDEPGAAGLDSSPVAMPAAVESSEGTESHTDARMTRPTETEHQLVQIGHLPTAAPAAPPRTSRRRLAQATAVSTPGSRSRDPSSAAVPPRPSVNQFGEALVADDPRLRPAAENTNLQQRPAVGAVQAALAKVVGAARQCVAGQSGASKATVTFSPNGRVRSVSVSGPAAGTPSADCVRRALESAAVAPFAEPSFSFNATVRP